MTWSVQWEPEATNQVAGFLKADPTGVAAVLDACDALEGGPMAAGSSAWGPYHRRLRSGPWRILYRIDEDTQTIDVEHVGRSA
ncbi:type II toxin-antitoxin system RelE/ParE family toxin [Streptomyces sp. NPDC057910]|uniref:type II toxin-antitoxin system RelE family toxin n=1 Tax=Streptomyces sp. NPDC057910 TaxID=3346278 RepID=UPI0036E0486B